MPLLSDLFPASQIRKVFASRRTILYKTAYSWCHDASLADDLVQETLLKALKSARTLRKREALDPWLFRILSHCWHDHLRTANRTAEWRDIADEQQFAQLEQYQAGEIVARVRTAVGQLPMPLREILTLSDFSGFSYAEISQILEIPVGTVMSRLFRARKALKSALLHTQASRPGTPRLRRVK